MAGLNDPWEYKKFWHQFNGQFENQDEQGFWDDQLSEWFGIYGVPLKYYPLNIDITKSDRIFGEVTTVSYDRVVHLTGVIDNNSIDENILYNTFGQLNNVEFVMFVHQHTFLKQVGRKPLPNDQFTLVNNVSTQNFEVVHTNESTLGTQGNFFGHRGLYILTVRERTVSQSLRGDGEKFGVTDMEGNLLPNIPEDAIVDDGSGRVRDKYDVPGIRNVEGSLYGDNKAIRGIVSGKDENGEDAMPEGQGIVYRQGDDKSLDDWGNW
jgi:hypothetical protein